MIQSLQMGGNKPLNLLFCVAAFYENYSKEMFINGLDFLLSQAMKDHTPKELSIIESKEGEVTIFTGNTKKVLPSDSHNIKIVSFGELSQVIAEMAFTRRLVHFVVRNLINVDILRFSVIKLTGSLEIAQMVRFFLEENKNVDGVITMGVVLKGQTDHYEYVCAETMRSIQKLASKAKSVITTGIITAREEEHVRDRVSKAGKNMGAAWVKACLDCIYVKRQIELS